MGETFLEKLEQSSKPLDVRAAYTRDFLEDRKISNADFIQKAGDIGVVISEEDIKDNKKLVTKIFDIQKALKFEEIDSKEGTDGMFGLHTLGRLGEFIAAKTERKDASADAAETAKADAVAAKPQAPIQQEQVASATIKPDKNSNQSETPQANIDKILKTFPGKSEVVRLSGNGGRQVVIYVPQGFDSSKPVEIDYHFHGMRGNWVDVPFPKLAGTGPYYHAGRIGAGSNRITQALAAAQKHRNMVLVYPLSAGQRGAIGSLPYKNGYDGEWMKKGNGTDNMANLHIETLVELKRMLGSDLNSASVTLSGHSAGGLALSNAVASGFKADKIKFLDASYSGWASNAYAKAKGKPRFELYVVKGTKTDKPNTRSLNGKEGVKYVTTNQVKHGDFNSAYL